MRQLAFEKTNWDHRFCHGGTLRKSRHGRRARPLSSKEPLHAVFKIRKGVLKKGLRNPMTYTLATGLLRKYSKKFHVKVEQMSVNPDHIHLLLRCSRRSLYHHFFRVFAGQFAQRLTGTFHEKLQVPSIWKARPWSRVLRGWRSYKTVRHYIKLNAKEASGERPYRKERTKRFSDNDLEALWA